MPRNSVKGCVQVGHTGYVVALAAIAPGKIAALKGGGIVSGSRDTTIRLWDIETKASIGQLTGHKYQVNAVAVLPSGQLVSGGLDGFLIFWDGNKSGQEVHAHPGSTILCMLALSDGTLLTGVPFLPQWYPHLNSNGHFVYDCD